MAGGRQDADPPHSRGRRPRPADHHSGAGHGSGDPAHPRGRPPGRAADRGRNSDRAADLGRADRRRTIGRARLLTCGLPRGQAPGRRLPGVPGRTGAVAQPPGGPCLSRYRGPTHYRQPVADRPGQQCPQPEDRRLLHGSAPHAGPASTTRRRSHDAPRTPPHHAHPHLAGQLRAPAVQGRALPRQAGDPPRAGPDHGRRAGRPRPRGRDRSRPTRTDRAAPVEPRRG